MIFSVQLDNLAVGERKDILYISNFRKKNKQPNSNFSVLSKEAKVVLPSQFLLCTAHEAKRKIHKSFALCFLPEDQHLKGMWGKTMRASPSQSIMPWEPSSAGIN